MKTRRTAFPKYTHNYRDRHGKLRSDFRRGAVNIPLPYPLLGPEYWKPIEMRSPTMAEFKLELAPNTQRGHFNLLRRWCDQWGDHRISHVRQRHVLAG
jgi:hypothetical protein